MNYKKHIEYTNLKNMTSKEVRKFVEFANVQGYYGVCLLEGTLTIAHKYKHPDLKLITVAGFPPVQLYPHISKSYANMLTLGLYPGFEIERIHRIIDDGLADELDMIFPLFWYYSQKLLRIHKFLVGIKKRFKKPLKVITEIGTVFTEQKFLWELSKMLEDSGVDFFKTNSGLIKQPFVNLAHYVNEIKQVTNLKIKAAGGIKTMEEVDILLKMGVSRIGTSAIIEEKNETTKL